MTARDAKEFLISQIADQATHDGVPLSEIERKMLYFSETGWTLPDIVEVNELFDRDYDESAYEQKIPWLIGHARKRRPDGWSAAIKVLDREDHYLSVIIELATGLVRPPGDLWKLWGTGTAIVLIILLAVIAYSSHR